MCRYLQPSAFNNPVAAWDYTSAMMIKHIPIISAAVLAAGAVTMSLAFAQQGYPVTQQGYPGYSAPPEPYPPGNYHRGSGRPDFDGLDDEDGPGSTALSPPGQLPSPDDPRYARPAGVPPVYSDRPMPTGPVLSPDDPRYGRPMGAPPAYSDRTVPTGPVLSPDDPRYGRPMAAPPAYSDRTVPTGPVVSPDDPRYGRPAEPPPQTYSDRDMRPPAAVGAPGAPPVRCSAPVGL